jgi:hypothetical protein
MPPTLRELQAAVAAYLAGEPRADLEAAVIGDSIPAAARLRVHRHHVRDSLTAVLVATFPTVQAVVGEDFFRRLAHAFVEATLPVQPVLAEYGAGFPDFLGAHQSAGELPYLADVARLDGALNAAFHAPPGRRLAAADLAGLPADGLLSMRLALASGATVLGSVYPLDGIWRASQPGAPDDPVGLDEGGVRLLVLRQEDDAAFVRLIPGEATFLACVVEGKALEAAADAAFRVDSTFDLSACFARFIGLGAFAALQ